MKQSRSYLFLSLFLICLCLCEGNKGGKKVTASSSEVKVQAPSSSDNASGKKINNLITIPYWKIIPTICIGHTSNVWLQQKLKQEYNWESQAIFMAESGLLVIIYRISTSNDQCVSRAHNWQTEVASHSQRASYR